MPRPSTGARRALCPLILALGLLPGSLGCASAALQQQRDRESSAQSSDAPQGTPVALPTRTEFAEIAALEEARQGGERLIELLRQGDPPLQARAALALGRMPLLVQGDGITKALCVALDDRDRVVRQRAAWALGQRGDPSACGVLARHWNDPDSSVRAKLVEAGGRLGENTLNNDLLRSLLDPDLSVRLEALAGLARWDGAGRDATRIDYAIIGALSTAHAGRAGGPGAAEELWMALHALGRRGSERGRAAFLQFSSHEDPTVRLFAAQGLVKLGPDWGAGNSVESLNALLSATSDADWRVVVEALAALAKRPLPAMLSALERCLKHPSAHVRQRAAEALGAFGPGDEIVLTQLLRGLSDRSFNVRAAALEGLARSGPKALAIERVRQFAGEDDAVLKAAAARAAAYLDADSAAPILEICLRDTRPFVSTAAIEALGKLPTDSNLALLRRELDGQFDNGRRLAAVMALRLHSSDRDLPHLEAAIRSSAGDVAPEVAWNALLNVRLIGGDATKQILEQALRYPHPRVRQTAREVWADLYSSASLPVVQAAPEAARTIPLPGVDYPRWARNPIVELETNRGSLFIELYPADAPLHVYSFLELISRGEFDGRSIHRVVPDFVVQGGDPRGDGNGGADWRGSGLRSEFNERKFLRGSLGMPRNEDLDSGGCQFFLTHRPTPHLDGNYTLFGQLVRGFDVLDLLEVGDSIVHARRVVEQQAPRR